MANTYQTAAFNRKAAYAGLMVAIFVATLLLRGKPQIAGAASLTVNAQAERLKMSTLSRPGSGQLSGQAIRLVLTGSQGLVTSVLWLYAQEKQRNQEWNKVEVLVDSVMKLQPYFTVPWLFQSWNLAYNISVELDRLNDMYFYIARGISLLAEGDAINSESAKVGSPDMRYYLAFYYQNKFTVSDKVNTLRCLYDLSCIPPDERNWKNLLEADGRTVSMEAFEAFCRKNPQLVRRLRDANLIEPPGPKGVVNFLKENEKVPTRYRRAPDSRSLEAPLKQFPVLPPQFLNDENEELTPKNAIGDRGADAVLAARAWYRYAAEPTPPPTYKPIGTVYSDEVRTKYRIPKSPGLIIFLQGAPRAQSYVAERLAKEGWLDADPWDVDEFWDANDPECWFADDRAGKRDVKIEPTMTSLEAWRKAHDMWQDHGLKYGLMYDPTTLAGMVAKATPFARSRGMSAETAEGTVRPTQNDLDNPAMRESYEALDDLLNYRYSLRVTNFRTHLYTAEGEMDPDTVAARKVLYRAEQYRLKPGRAIPLYERGFELFKKVWLKKPVFHRGVDGNGTEGDKVQEDLYEMQIRYLKMKLEADLQKRREAVMGLNDLMNSGGALATHNVWQLFGNLYPLDQSRIVSLGDRLDPLAHPGPLDELDPTGRPWIAPEVKDRVLSRIGTVKKPQPQQPAPSEGPVAP